MSERWDVYDLDRLPTGRTLLRGEAHDSELCQLVVHVCLFNRQGQMLIQQRSMRKKGFPGYWDVSVGGGVLAGETGREAAMRETREELGLAVEINRAAAVTLSFEGGFDDYYLLDWDGDLSLLTLQTEEVQCVRWADCEEIQSMIEAGTFAPFWPSFVQLLFDLHRHAGLKE